MRYPISPLDGRYGERTESFSDYFSEFALINARCHVEARYLQALDDAALFPPLSAGERAAVAELIENGIGPDDFLLVKEIESVTRHDVKACELFLTRRLAIARPNMVHFGLTSEDVNNLAYGLLLSRCRDDCHIPLLRELMAASALRVSQWKSVLFPAHTHGQPASPTTAGKEMAVFLARLLRQFRLLKSLGFHGKLNGAVGNYSAMKAAFPEFDWLAFSRQFVEALGLVPNIATTQVEDHDSWCEYFDLTRRVNNIVMDMDMDLWQYISRGYFRQAVVEGEVGSSTMPHKTNPINFENSEGNLAVSNSLLTMLSDRLSRSRMQRDLSDSTVERNIGVALSHSFLALTETLRGLAKLEIDSDGCTEAVLANPQLLAEPIQTILRTTDIADPYDRVKQLTRGAHIGREDLDRFIYGLEVDEPVKARLSALSVTEYTGEAVKLCDLVLKTVNRELER